LELQNLNGNIFLLIVLSDQQNQKGVSFVISPHDMDY
jgi:hypothetical protein